VEHRCFIHHLPRDNSHILQLLGRSEGSPHDAKFEDRATVEYMGEIYKFEFHEFQKQQRHDPTLTLQNVQFLCEGPSNAGQGLVELRKKWDTMWDASTIHPHGRSRAGHLSGAEGLQGGPIHQHGEHVISSAGHPIVVGKWQYDPIRPSGVEERLHGPMYPRDGGVRSKAAMPMHPRDVPGRQERLYDSQYLVQNLQMQHNLHRSDLERTGHEKFWDELRSNLLLRVCLSSRLSRSSRRSPLTVTSSQNSPEIPQKFSPKFPRNFPEKCSREIFRNFLPEIFA
jgi:hypothetical protein